MKLTRNLLERALWTAAQAGLAVLAASGTGFVDIAVWKSAALAAGAAALSALKTAVQEARSGVHAG